MQFLLGVNTAACYADALS